MAQAQDQAAVQQQIAQLLVQTTQIVADLNNRAQQNDNDRQNNDRDFGAKLAPLTSVEAEDFVNFKRNLTGFLVGKPTWNAERKKRHLRSLLQDSAGLLARSVDFAYEDAGVAFEVVLERVEAKFLAGAGTSKAYDDYIGAVQRSTETLHAWHGRLLDLHERAFPDLAEQQREANEQLRNSFIVGLRDQELRGSVFAQPHATYAELLINTSRAEAILASIRRARNPGQLNQLQPSTSTAPAAATQPGEAAAPHLEAIRAKISALEAQEGQRCHLCNAFGHFARQCPYMKKAMDLMSGRGRGRGGNRRNGRGGSRGRGFRGRYNNGNRNGFGRRNPNSLNAMAPSEDERLLHELTSEEVNSGNE